MAEAKNNDVPQPENPGDARLLANFQQIMDAIQDGQLSTIVGVAVTRDGNMIDLFGTAGNQLFEYAALTQVENLRENLRHLQNRRMLEEQKRQQQAALDVAAAIHSAPNDNEAEEAPRKRAKRRETK